jgi:hypothetical protein
MPLLGDSGESERHSQRIDYMNNGKCRLIWVLDPVTGRAQIYSKKKGLKNCRRRQEKMWTILDGGDVFPGLFLTPFLLERVARQDPDEDSCIVRCPICDEMLWHAFVQEHIRDMHREF